MTKVKFMADCGDWKAGEKTSIDTELAEALIKARVCVRVVVELVESKTSTKGS